MYREDLGRSRSWPCDKTLWDKLPSMRELQSCLSEVGKGECSDPAALKATTQNFQDKKWQIQQVVALVTSAVAGFRKAKQTTERDQETRIKKEKSRAQKAEKAAAKEAARRSKLPQRTLSNGWAAWKLLRGHTDIAERQAMADADCTWPWITRGSETAKQLFESKPIKLNFLVFRTGFQKSSGGFEQRVFKEGSQVRTKMMEVAGLLAAQDVVSFPEREMQEVADECSLWGLRVGEEHLSVVNNGLGALMILGSERASMQVLLVPVSVA